jgi:uncharacterized membrane protein
MKKIFYLIFAVFFLLPTVSAFTVINIYIDESGDSTFLGETDLSEIQLPQGIENRNGEIIGVSSDLTNKEGEVWSFIYALENSEIRVILPKNSILTSVSGGDISVENERITIFANNIANLEYIIKGTNLEIQIFSNKILFGIIGIVLLIILIFYVVNYRNREITEKNKENKILNSLKKVLNEREKLILENLSKYGKMKSSYLRKLTDIPKASFSRHIQELEKKKLIVRSGEGKNKFVELNDEYVRSK